MMSIGRKRSLLSARAINPDTSKSRTYSLGNEWFLHETNSGCEAAHRVIYAESCKTVEEALKLVATRIVSANLGEVFLHSPLSLDDDVLGDAGLAAIRDLFTPSPV
jgi:hypothetical protein